MSRGPGKIEHSLTELFTESADTDAVYSVADLCRQVFGSSAPPTRAQRISVLRAAHRAIKRARQKEISNHLASAPDEPQHNLLCGWRITERADRTIVFHDRYYPVRVWALDIVPQGVLWAEAEIRSITQTRVNIRYRDDPASLDRYRLGFHYALWRGVYFVSERNGYVAGWFQQQWADEYGYLFPTLLPLDEAKRLLDVPDDYTREDIISAFRRAAQRAHPDHGGTAEAFRKLVEARDRLLASIGTSAPAPKMPTFAPSGVKLYYSSAARSTPRLSDYQRLRLQ